MPTPPLVKFFTGKKTDFTGQKFLIRVLVKKCALKSGLPAAAPKKLILPPVSYATDYAPFFLRTACVAIANI